MYDLDAIKGSLTCRDVAERLSIELPRHANGDAKCPRHGGKSLRVKDDYFKCHGGCANNGGKGDIFNLYQFVTGSDFSEAVTTLADWAGVRGSWTDADIKRIEQRRKIEDILGWAAEWYHQQYPNSPAHTYATSRCIDIDEAKLGYAPDQWDGLVTALTTAGLDLAQADEAGLIRMNKRGSYYDTLRHRLIIPAYERGRCTYIQGRSLGQGTTVDANESDRKYKNVALDEPPLYHLNGALNPGTAPILTESTTDVLRLSVEHLPAVGTYGAKLEPQHIRRLKRCELLYVAAQNDTAGINYVDAMAEAFGEAVRVAPTPEGYKDWDKALNAGQQWTVDDGLTWVRWRLKAIPQTLDAVRLRRPLDPILHYLAHLDDAAIAAQYLDEMRKHFGWSREVAKGYEQRVKTTRAAVLKAAQEKQSLKHDDSGTTVNVKPDPTFINPAQAYHDGITYVARMVTRAVPSDWDGSLVDVYTAAIITSDRRLLIPPEPPKKAPAGMVIYLDDAQTLALRRSVDQASDNWSYPSYTAHLAGNAPAIKPHEVFDRLLASLKRYVYHEDSGDYIIDVLWCMGTYLHQQFDAFPYLAIHGHKGSGKTTLLHWLGYLAFNARHTVNSSEASLFRWIEAAAPTMLIDEQEGLNSRAAAKDEKADLMGILKAGYQKGAVVTRQDPNNPAVTQTFSVYSPKAVAAIEQFEDILEDRSLLTYMPKVDQETLKRHTIDDRRNIDTLAMQALRDDLYLFLMQYSTELQVVKQKVRNAHGARFGELAFPLLCIAALVDASRGQGRNILDALDNALGQQQKKRADRNAITPESMLAEAVSICVENAVPLEGTKPKPEEHPQRLGDGTVVMDSHHIMEAFASLFPSRKESYFRVEWLGKQVAKTAYINNYRPDSTKRDFYRWRRTITERTDAGIMQDVVKMCNVYIVDPQRL